MNEEGGAPIFVVGTGRSGSTLFFDIFAGHPNVAWLSQLAMYYPRRLWLNRLAMRCRSLPGVDVALGKRLGPSEAYPFWDLHCRGFSNPYRDLEAGDVTPVAAARLRHGVTRTLTGERNRFLAKITGWPRVRYLREIFPRALFVEVTRNPFATVSSLLEVPFWDGWRGPTSWRRGPLPSDLANLWREEGESFVALAAIEYAILNRAMEVCRATLPPTQLYSVSYSRLCADPVEVFRGVTEFCRLKWSTRFEAAIRRIEVENRDDKWRAALTADQQAILQRTLEKANVFVTH